MKRTRNRLGQFTKKQIRWDEVRFWVAVLFFPTIAICNAVDANRPIEQPHFIEVAEAEEVEEKKPILIEINYDWDSTKVEEEIRKAFPESPGVAVAIAKCESQYHIKGDIFIQSMMQQPYGQEESFGIFQIHMPDHAGTTKKLGLDVMKNPYHNIEFARYLYEKAGKKFTDWSCYNQNLYQKYL